MTKWPYLLQFYVFAFMGFGTFMPKYVEYQFRQKGSASSTFAGGVGTVSKAIGLLVSAIFMADPKKLLIGLSRTNRKSFYIG